MFRGSLWAYLQATGSIGRDEEADLESAWLTKRSNMAWGAVTRSFRSMRCFLADAPGIQFDRYLMMQPGFMW